MTHLDPDPLTVEDAWTEGYFAGYGRAIEDSQSRRLTTGWAALAGLLVGVLLMAMLAAAARAATPRAVPLPSIPVADAGQLGVPPAVTPALLATTLK